VAKNIKKVAKNGPKPGLIGKKSCPGTDNLILGKLLDWKYDYVVSVHMQ